MPAGTVTAITTLPSGDWVPCGALTIATVNLAFFLDKSSNKVISVTLA